MMTVEQIIEALRENIIQGRRDENDEGLVEGMVGKPGARELTEAAIQADIEPKVIIAEGLTAGMKVVGEKYETGEYFIPDMLASAEAVGVAMEILGPHLMKSGVKSKGKVIMATVKGDLHDIGKNIVSLLLKGIGYEVKDLGADVPPEKIVDAVREEKADFLGLSALLTTTMRMMGETINKLKEAGLRDKVNVLVGGAAVSQDFANEIGADAYGVDGFHAVRIVDEFQSRKEE
jgi:5-methyltetrahydrofolate--homocysteine methyltransferase